MSENLMSNLEQEQIKREQQDIFRNILFLDLETGDNPEDEVTNVRKNELRNSIMQEKYNYHSGYGDDTNKKKEKEFDQKKHTKLANAIKSMNERDAVSPFFNRICILGVAEFENGKLYCYQHTELESTEEEMIDNLFSNLDRRTIITYGGESFDIPTLRIKAAKYGIEIPFLHHIDLFKAVKIWPPAGKPEFISQHLISAVLGIKPNEYEDSINKERIGHIFRQAKGGLTGLVKTEVETILKYNLEDLRVLSEIYVKLKSVGLV
jgi:DNA polymerase elongation subunit (family B)